MRGWVSCSGDLSGLNRICCTIDFVSYKQLDRHPPIYATERDGSTRDTRTQWIGPADKAMEASACELTLSASLFIAHTG